MARLQAFAWYLLRNTMEEQLACEATSNDFDAHQFAEQHFWAPYHSLERLVFAEVRCLALPSGG